MAWQFGNLRYIGPCQLFAIDELITVSNQRRGQNTVWAVRIGLLYRCGICCSRLLVGLWQMLEIIERAERRGLFV